MRADCLAASDWCFFALDNSFGFGFKLWAGASMLATITFSTSLNVALDLQCNPVRLLSCGRHVEAHRHTSAAKRTGQHVLTRAPTRARTLERTGERRRSKRVDPQTKPKCKQTQKRTQPRTHAPPRTQARNHAHSRTRPHTRSQSHKYTHTHTHAQKTHTHTSA